MSYHIAKVMSSAIICLFLLAGVRTEEVATPSKLLGPKNFNHHPFEASQYLKETSPPKPTQQGPVLFPNDAPPPPRPPLIVTSRPLLESITRSELNPNPPQNQQNEKPKEPENYSVAEQTQLNRVQFKPGFLARLKNYQPYSYDVTPNYLSQDPESSLVLVNSVTGKPVSYPDYDDIAEDYHPYADVVKKSRLLNNIRDNRYDDYEERTILPPIYKALSDHAKQKVLKIRQKDVDLYHKYQVKDAGYSQRYQTNHIPEDEIDYNQDQNSNYAFSYKVKDQKTGDDFSHSQQSSGSATNGEYRVRLPDGRMQIVSYTADENGYKADVRYDDEDKTAGNKINHNNYYRSNNHFNQEPQFNREYNDDHFNYENEREFKKDTPVNEPIKDDYYNQYSDISKETYNDDYSLEFNGKDNSYQPHTSKFTDFAENKEKVGTIVVPNQFEGAAKSSTVRPSYEELKSLFQKNPIRDNTEYLYSNIPVEINVPSTTPRPGDIEDTTERVVLIGNQNKQFYTNIKNSLPPLEVTTPIPYSFSTPSNYLVSSISPLKNVDFSGSKPVLSSSFIDRINKYIHY